MKLQSISRLGMGIDNLPEEIRNSKILTGHELAHLKFFFESILKKLV